MAPPQLKAWNDTLSKVRSENPKLSLKQAMKKAKIVYRKTKKNRKVMKGGETLEEKTARLADEAAKLAAKNEADEAARLADEAAKLAAKNEADEAARLAAEEEAKKLAANGYAANDDAANDDAANDDANDDAANDDAANDDAEVPGGKRRKRGGKLGFSEIKTGGKTSSLGFSEIKKGGKSKKSSKRRR